MTVRTRDYFVSNRATKNEKGVVAFLSKVIGRSID
jgi:hypothetical protein